MNPYELAALNKLAQHLDNDINMHTERVHENVQFDNRLNSVTFSRGAYPSNTSAKSINDNVYIMFIADKETTMYAVLAGKNVPFDKEVDETMGIKIAQYSDTEEDITKLATFINNNV